MKTKLMVHKSECKFKKAPACLPDSKAYPNKYLVARNSTDGPIRQPSPV